MKKTNETENDYVTEIVHGVKLRAGGDSVVKVFRQDGNYEPEVMDIWTSHAAKKGVMVDIGCYTGLYTLKASLLGASVHAIEPNPVALDRAIQNARLNPSHAFNGPYKFYNIALANYVGEGSIYFNPRNKLTSAATLIERWPTAIDVHIETMDSIFQKFNRISCIKMDAERSEFPIILGGLKTIERLKPTLIIEMLDREQDYLNLSEVLLPIGYKYEELPRSQSVWTPT